MARDDKKLLLFDAAFACFTTYGYSKTSLDDIAKKAGVSRSSIYLLFKNKDELFVSMVEDILEDKFLRAREIVHSIGSMRDKLTNIFEICYLEIWSKVFNSPHGVELFEFGVKATRDPNVKIEEHLSSIITEVIGDQELSEILCLAINGFTSDYPDPRILRNRIKRLLDLVVS